MATSERVPDETIARAIEHAPMPPHVRAMLIELLALRAERDPELAAAVARLEGAALDVEIDAEPGGSWVGRTIGADRCRGTLRDVLLALAADAGEEGR